MSSHFRPRAMRTAVRVPCRLNLGTIWVDGIIRNVSTRGIMVSTEHPVKRGAYIEIRRGTLIIIGRVMWSRDGCLGIRTQDPISAQTLIDEPVRSSRPVSAATVDERRVATRAQGERNAAQRSERSRRFASAFQFVCVVAAGSTLAILIAIYVYELLAVSASTVSDALSAAGE